MADKLRIGILFGGPSREREISFKGGKTAFEHMDLSLFTPVPIFVDSLGNFILIEPDLLYKESIKDFYPSKNLNRGFRIYIETLGKLNESQLYKLIYKIGRQIKPEKLSDYMDFAFCIMHGPYNEDGSIQGFLSWFNIPFMGPGILGSSIGISKTFQNPLLNLSGSRKKRFLQISRNAWYEKNKSELFTEIIQEIGFPFVIKAPQQGSSIGVAIIKKRSIEEFSKGMSQCFFDLTITQKDWTPLSNRQKKNFCDKIAQINESLGFPLVAEGEQLIDHPRDLITYLNKTLSSKNSCLLTALDSENEVLIEEFIEGREFSIGLIQDDDLNTFALPPTEIRAEDGNFDFKSKYQTASTRKIIPVETSLENLEKIEKSVLAAWKLTGMSVICRIDGFLTAHNEVVLHDPNTIPGMSPTSLIFKQMIELGFSVTEAITYMIRQSLIQRSEEGKKRYIHIDLKNRLDQLIDQKKKKTVQKVAVLFGENQNEYEIAQKKFNQFMASENYEPKCVCAAKNGYFYFVPISKMYKASIEEFGKTIGQTPHPYIEKLIKKTAHLRSFYTNNYGFQVQKIDSLKEEFDLIYNVSQGTFVQQF